MWKAPCTLNAKFLPYSAVSSGPHLSAVSYSITTREAGAASRSAPQHSARLQQAPLGRLQRSTRNASHLHPEAISCHVGSADDVPSTAAQQPPSSGIIRPVYTPAPPPQTWSPPPQSPADVTAAPPHRLPKTAPIAPSTPEPAAPSGAYTEILNLERRSNPITYLTKCLANAASLAILQQYVEVYGYRFDHIHVSAAITKLPKLADRHDPSSWRVARQLGSELGSRLFLSCLHLCTVREFANATWALGRLGLAPGDALVAGAMQRLVANKSALLKAGRAQEVANLAHGLANLGYSQDAIWDAISPLAQAQLPAFQSQELAALAWAYATIGHRDTPLFARLADEAQAKMATFSAWGLATIAWSFATMNHHDAPFFQALGGALLRNLPGCSTQGLANTIWAYARVYHYDAPLFQALSDAAMAQLPGFRNQELCNVMWAQAHLQQQEGAGASPLFAAAAEYALPRVHTFQPRELACTLWACGKLRYNSPSLVGAVVAASLPLVPAFEPRQLCCIVYSCALLRHSDPVLFDQVAQYAARCMPQFTPQGLAITLWAFARRAHQDPLLLATASRCALPQLHSFKPMELALLMWSLARLQHKDAALWRAAVPLVLRHVKAPRVHAKSIATFAWVYAVHGQYDEELFQVLGRAAVANISQFTVHDMTMLVWAFSVVQHVYSHMYDVVARRSVYMLHRFYSRDLATLTLAYAQMDHKSAYLYDAIGACAVDRRVEFDDATWRKLMGALAILGYNVDALLPDAPEPPASSTAPAQPLEEGAGVWPQ